MGPGTGSHIASDMRLEGRITLGISDGGGGGGGGGGPTQRWGPISLLHRSFFDLCNEQSTKWAGQSERSAVISSCSMYACASGFCKFTTTY